MRIQQQFFNVRFATMQKAKLNPAETLAFSLIDDRMASSEQRESFYDEQAQNFYVIYPQEELANNLNISVRTISRILHSLADKGLIILQNTMKATRIFINWDCKYLQAEFEDPKPENDVHNPNPDNESDKMADSKMPNWQNNHTNLNHKNTTDTTETENRTKPDHEKSKPQANHMFDGLVTSLKNYVPERIVNMLATMSFGNHQLLYKYSGLMFQAKKSVYKSIHRQGLDSSVVKFEYNDSIEQKLPQVIQRIITSAQRNAKNAEGFIYRSFVNFFDELANETLQES